MITSNRIDFKLRLKISKNEFEKYYNIKNQINSFLNKIKKKLKKKEIKMLFKIWDIIIQ